MHLVVQYLNHIKDLNYLLFHILNLFYLYFLNGKDMYHILILLLIIVLHMVVRNFYTVIQMYN